MPKAIDIKGKRFGRLVAIERSHKDNSGGWIWRCKCDCGNEASARPYSLKSGNTNSCGCLHKETSAENGKKSAKYSFNIDFFKNMSPDLAYILGLFASDGYLCDTNNQIKFSFSDIDIDVLEKIKIASSYNGEIYKRLISLNDKVYNVATLIFYSKELRDIFYNYGLTTKKSFTVSIPKEITDKYMIHFIRGFFDGDGSVGGQLIKGSQQMRVRIGCGSKEIIEQIKSWLHININTRNVKISERNNFYEIAYSTNDSIKLYESFYTNYSIFLDRKKKKFEEIMDIRNSR